MNKAALANDDNQQVPNLIVNMLKLRKLPDGEVNESYIFFCENFLKCVVGAQSFSKGWKRAGSISEIATLSDEALALLLLENSNYRWINLHQKKKMGEEVAENELVKPLYTAAGKHKQQKGFTKRYGGWKNDGIERFNELLDMVRADRLKNGVWFDEIVSARIKLSGVVENDDEVNASNCIKAGNDLVFEDDEEEKNEENVVQQQATV